VPRALFDIPLQATVDGKIIARETIKAFRKDVTKKCHGGGDADRKEKLLSQQREGKKVRKKYMCGNVELTQEILHSLLKMD
jgi:GTP-binding protein LepA